MPLLIGMDEAGYGPNLGPLVVTAVAWEVSGDARRVDLWREFAGIVAPEHDDSGRRLQIADSKAVYTPARGLRALERGVLAAVALWRQNLAVVPATCRALCQALAPQAGDAINEPWYAEGDLALPHVPPESPERDGELFAGWHDRCQTRQIRLRSIQTAIVAPAEFNRRTRHFDSKGRALTEVSMEVLAQAWRDAGGDPAQRSLVIADKHGGRNRYHEFLPIAFGDRFIECRGESLDVSCYRVGQTEIRFETKSERHLPVALASMVSKYVRELSMLQFNRFWTSRLPGLMPTAGYPVDAQRFRSEIAVLQRELQIEDDVLWRAR